MSSEETRKNHLCIACGQSIDPRDLASMQCGHPFHYQCLQISLGNQINKKEYPLCCPIPQCFVEPSMYFMSVVLEEPAFQDYLQLEKNSVQAFETYECPSYDQSFLAFQTNKTHKCLKCYKVICLECSQLAHPNKPCSSNDHGKRMKQQLAQQVIQQQQQQQPLISTTTRSPPKIISQPQTQQDSSHSRKHSQTQLQQPQQSSFTSAQLIQPLNSFFLKNQNQQQQEQQYNPQQQKQQYSTLQIQQSKQLQQQQQHVLKEYQQHQQSAQTTRKPSPRRNSIVSSNEEPKIVSVRQLSQKRNDSTSGDRTPNQAVHQKQLEQSRLNIIAQHAIGTIVKKQPQIGVAQQIQRKFSSTVAPSPTSAQFTHKKNSLSQVPGSYDYNNFVASPNKESNFSTTAANQSQIVSASTAPINKSAKTSRKSFDRGDAPFLQGTSEDINKILSQTAALMKLQPNVLLARKNAC